MGVLHDNHSKTSYYNLLRKEIKQSYINNCTSEFNLAYSLKIDEFIPRKKKMVKIIGEYTDWKLYLLGKLDTIEEKGWKNSLTNFIINENNKWFISIYSSENHVFFEQFSFRKFPQENLKPIETEY